MKIYLDGQLVGHTVNWPLVHLKVPKNLGPHATAVVEFCRSPAVTDAYRHEQLVILAHPYDLAVTISPRFALPNGWDLLTGDPYVDWHYERSLWGSTLKVIEMDTGDDNPGPFFYISYLDQSWTAPISTLAVAFSLATRLAARYILDLGDEARDIIFQGGGDPYLEGEPAMSRFDHILGET